MCRQSKPVAIAVLMVRLGIVRPITESVAVLKQLADGKYDLDVQGTTRGDEVGDVARAAQVFKEHGLQNSRLQQEQEAMKRRQETERQELMLELADEFERAVGTVVGAASSASSTQVLSSAGALSSQAERLSAVVREFLKSIHTGPCDCRVADDPNYRGPERRTGWQAAKAA